jgi:hypothetical protein
MAHRLALQGDWADTPKEARESGSMSSTLIEP